MTLRFKIAKPESFAEFKGYNFAELYESHDLKIMGDELIRHFEADTETSKKRHAEMKNYLEIYNQSEAVFKTSDGYKGRVFPTLTSAVNEFCAAASAVFPYEAPIKAEARVDIPTAEKVKYDIDKARMSAPPQDAVEGQPPTESPELPPEELEKLVQTALQKARLDKMITEESAEDAIEVLNYQFAEENGQWIEETLSSFGIMAIKGCFLRRIGYDPQSHKPTSEVIDPCEVFVSEGAKNAKEAERISVCREYSYAEIDDKIADKIFTSFDMFTSEKDPNEQNDLEKRYTIVETVTRADLDGDGFPEPYVFFTDLESREVVRIERNFYEDDAVVVDGKAVAIEAKARFILYNFLPDYCGGFFGRGLGDMLANPAKTLSGLVSITMGAAVRATLGGGLIDAAVNVSGEMTAGKFTKAKVLSGDLSSALAPFPLPEPSPAVISLIELYKNSVDVLANISGFNPADMPPNMPATNMAMIASKSMEKFTAVFRNYLRSFQKEIDAFVKCNANYFLAEKYQILIHRAPEKEAFSNNEIRFVPAIDVRLLTQSDKMIFLNFLNEKAQDPFFNPMKVRREALLSFDVKDPESYISQPAPPPPAQPDPLIEAQVAVYAGQAKVFEAQALRTEAETKRIIDKTEDEVINLKTKSIKDLAEAESKEVGLQNEAYNLERMQLMEKTNDALTGTISRPANDVGGEPLGVGAETEQGETGGEFDGVNPVG